MAPDLITFGDRTNKEYAQAEKLDLVGLNLNKESFYKGYEKHWGHCKYDTVQQRIDRLFHENKTLLPPTKIMLMIILRQY